MFANALLSKRSVKPFYMSIVIGAVDTSMAMNSLRGCFNPASEPFTKLWTIVALDNSKSKTKGLLSL
jgi:hypothetical protein